MLLFHLIAISMHFAFVTVNCEKLSGTINVGKDDGFSFLGKFCFGYRSNLDKDAGWVTVNLDNAKENDKNEYKLLLYDDEDSSWPKIYNQGKTCLEKISNNYQRSTRKFNFYSNNDADNNANTYFYRISVHQHIRPRWWWLYLAQCDAGQNETFGAISFDLHFEQANADAWSREFGMNQKDLNTLYLVYLVLYIGLVSAQVYAYFLYRIQQYIHQVIKLQTATMVVQLFGVLFHFVDWIIFMETGEHEMFFSLVAILADIVASSIFLLLLLVLAQGWTISRFEVRYPRLLLCAVIITAGVRAGFYIWRLLGLDLQSTVYFYNSLPAMCYGGVMIAIGIVFECFCICSYLRESVSSKRMLYASLGALYGVWFLWPLAQIFIGNAFSPWTKDIATTAISLTVTTIEYSVMMLLLWPTWAHNYFNLSVVDTQSKMLAAGDASNVVVQAGTKEYQVLEHERL